MSFMSGFADAFGKQIQQGEEESAQRKQDAFRVAYDSYLKKKDQWTTDKKQDADYVASAHALVSSLPNVPDGAWEYAYQWKKSGMADDAILKRLNATTFAASDSPAMADGMGTLTNDTGAGPKSNIMDDQMVRSGMQPMTQPPPDQSQGMNLGNMFDPKAIQDRQMGQAQDAVSSATGDDQGTLDAINQGYSPTTPPHTVDVVGFDKGKMSASGEGGIPKAGDTFQIPTANGYVVGVPDGQGGFNDMAGQPITATGQAVTNQLASDQNQMIKTVSDSAKEVRAKRGVIAGVAHDLKYMDDIAQSDPTAITRVANIPNFVNEAMGEVKGLKSMFDSGDTKALADKESQVEGWLTEQFKGAGMTAEHAQLFASRKTAVVFELARMVNGGGASGISNKDTDAIAASLLSVNDPAIFNQNAKDIITGLMQNSDTDVTNFNADLNNVALGKQYGVDSSKQFVPFDQLMGKDTYAWLTKKSDAKPLGDSGTSTNGSVQGNPELDKAPAMTIKDADDAKRYGLDPSLAGKKIKLVGDQLYVEQPDGTFK